MIGNKINIMFVIGSMGNGRAGTERNLLTIIEHLDRDRFEPYLVSVQDCEFIQAGSFKCDTTCLHFNRMFTSRMRQACRLLAQRIKKLDIDIVQTFFVEGHLVGGSAARKAGVRAIISSRRNLGYSYTFKERMFLKIANRYPSRFLANCQAVAKAISQIESIDINRFDVIYNGVPDINTTVESNNENLPPTVVLLANLRPVKQIQTLIDAASIVVERIPQTKFVIVGDGPDRGILEQRVQDHSLTDNITFAGSQDDTVSVLSQATVGVLTSMSEGCSNSILEYMRSGLPVVATNVGGNPELIIEDETGYLVPVGEKNMLASRLIHLLEKQESARQMGSRGREQWQRHFSLEVMMQRYHRYYSQLLRK